jgi:hypothetical protein
MKRFWLVLLSLGLIMAFSVSAFAVDVKVSADYYVGGLYLNKTSVHNGFETYNPQQPSFDPTPANPSTAFFYQDLRVGADFIVAPCLKLVTQFDAMERIWGGMRSDVDVPDAHGAGTRAEAENISIRQVHIDYTSPIGLFKVGYLEDFVFGTVFGDSSSGPTSGQIQYFIQKGPFTGFLGYAKEVDNSASAVTSSTVTDNDFDSYRIAGIYNFKGGEAGALFMWNRDATNKVSATPPAGPYLSNVFVIDPYVKAKIGPVALQAEAQYWFGDAMKWEGIGPNPANVSVSALSVFVDATADFNMFYAGGSFAYLSGDDNSKKDQVTGGVNTGGLDWNPCLIMFNQDLNYWAGNIAGHGLTQPGYSGYSSVDSEMSNAWFFQGRVGIKPTAQWNVLLAVSYAMADKKPGFYDLTNHYFSYPNSTYGTEIDLTATYKITNNLSYMLGAGYLFTGDYFKGFDAYQLATAKVNDDYMLINKLTLSF